MVGCEFNYMGGWGAYYIYIMGGWVIIDISINCKGGVVIKSHLFTCQEVAKKYLEVGVVNS